MPRDVQEPLGQDVAIRSCDAQVWLQACQLSKKVCLFARNDIFSLHTLLFLATRKRYPCL